MSRNFLIIIKINYTNSHDMCNEYNLFQTFLVLYALSNLKQIAFEPEFCIDPND
jgi:hypothetical protein